MSAFANKAMYSSTLVAFAVLQGCEEVPVNHNQNHQVVSEVIQKFQSSVEADVEDEVIQKFQSSVEAVVEGEVIEPLLEIVTPSLECKQTFIEKFFKVDTHQTITSGATGTTKVEGVDAGLFDAFRPIDKEKDYLYKGLAIKCTIGATVEDTTCDGPSIEDEASRTAITTCVQRTEMQHSKHLKITAAVLGLVVVAIIVAVVLAFHQTIFEELKEVAEKAENLAENGLKKGKEVVENAENAVQNDVQDAKKGVEKVAQDADKDVEKVEKNA
jgi:hypothetical protein